MKGERDGWSVGESPRRAVRRGEMDNCWGGRAANLVCRDHNGVISVGGVEGTIILKKKRP